MIKIYIFLLFFSAQNLFCMRGKTQVMPKNSRNQQEEYWQRELKQRVETKKWWDGYFKELMEMAREEQRKTLAEKK